MRTFGREGSASKSPAMSEDLLSSCVLNHSKTRLHSSHLALQQDVGGYTSYHPDSRCLIKNLLALVTSD